MPNRVLFFFAIVLQVTTLCNSLDIDPKDIGIINGKRYYFSPLEASINSATISCNDVGMALVAIETQEEMTGINEYVLANNIPFSYFHTSGVRVRDHWLWSSSGQLFTYARWLPGEPNMQPYPVQACVSYQNGYLMDYSCNEHLFFICEEVAPCNKTLSY